jgi:hypothetical protein
LFHEQAAGHFIKLTQHSLDLARYPEEQEHWNIETAYHPMHEYTVRWENDKKVSHIARLHPAGGIIEKPTTLFPALRGTLHGNKK